ncbi:MAG: hypothetical protein RL373_1586 [Pseudomonadota bacterium]|jgi:chemotaxis protein MotB
MPKDGPPIVVVKRVKKGGHAAHGGAWKIAYADFVTAMMAFFLLMWVLGSTTAGDLAGISSYFQNPLRISMAGGQGSGDTTRIIKSGGGSITMTTGQEAKADADTDERRVSNSQSTEIENARRDNTSLTSSLQEGGPGGKDSGMSKAEAQEMQEKVKKSVADDPELSKLKGQIFMDITTDGLRIQVVDEKNRPLFTSGGTIPTESGRRLMRVIGKALAASPSPIRIEGHTDGTKYPKANTNYSNWELSAERANTARREMVSGGLAEERISQVIGFADKYPLNPEDLNDPLNRRISITVLNQKPKVAPTKTAGVAVSGNELGGSRPIEGIKPGSQDIPSNLKAPDSKDLEGARTPQLSLPSKPSAGPVKPTR